MPKAEEKRVFRGDSEPLDSLDAEFLAEMMDSRGWLLVSTRLQAAFAQKVIELRQARPEDVGRVQGFLDGIERALQFPRMLMDEATAKGK